MSESNLAVNKTRIGLPIGLDWIPDRIGLLFSLLVQNYYFEKNCFNNVTGGSEQEITEVTFKMSFAY